MWAGHGDLLEKNAYGCLCLVLSQDPGALRLFLSNPTLPCFWLPAAARGGWVHCLLTQSYAGGTTWTSVCVRV